MNEIEIIINYQEIKKRALESGLIVEAYEDVGGFYFSIKDRSGGLDIEVESFDRVELVVDTYEKALI